MRPVDQGFIDDFVDFQTLKDVETLSIKEIEEKYGKHICNEQGIY